MNQMMVFFIFIYFSKEFNLIQFNSLKKRILKEVYKLWTWSLGSPNSPQNCMAIFNKRWKKRRNEENFWRLRSFFFFFFFQFTFPTLNFSFFFSRNQKFYCKQYKNPKIKRNNIPWNFNLLLVFFFFFVEISTLIYFNLKYRVHMVHYAIEATKNPLNNFKGYFSCLILCFIFYLFISFLQLHD